MTDMEKAEAVINAARALAQINEDAFYAQVEADKARRAGSFTEYSRREGMSRDAQARGVQAFTALQLALDAYDEVSR